MNNQIQDNLQKLLHRIPTLPPVLEKLKETPIRYGLYAGSHVALLTGNRIPTDVDFLVHDEDLDLLRQVFPDIEAKEDESGELFLYTGSDKEIEFMGKATVEKDGHAFLFRLTDLAVSKLKTYKVNGYQINLVDPADTILLKAILRRGKEKNKFDIEDIQDVLAKVPIDFEYLQARAAESNAVSYTKEIWERFGLVV